MLRQTARVGALALSILTPLAAMTSLVESRKVEVVIYHSNEALYQAFFDAFQRKTGIEAVPVWYTGSQISKWEQTITKIAGGISPDVVTTTSTEFVQYAAAGLIEPLNTFQDRDKTSLTDVIPIFLTALQWKGKQYQMPYGACPGYPLLITNSYLHKPG